MNRISNFLLKRLCFNPEYKGPKHKDKEEKEIRDKIAHSEKIKKCVDKLTDKLIAEKILSPQIKRRHINSIQIKENCLEVTLASHKKQKIPLKDRATLKKTSVKILKKINQIYRTGLEKKKKKKSQNTSKKRPKKETKTRASKTESRGKEVSRVSAQAMIQQLPSVESATLCSNSYVQIPSSKAVLLATPQRAEESRQDFEALQARQEKLIEQLHETEKALAKQTDEVEEWKSFNQCAELILDKHKDRAEQAEQDFKTLEACQKTLMAQLEETQEQLKQKQELINQQQNEVDTLRETNKKLENLVKRTQKITAQSINKTKEFDQKLNSEQAKQRENQEKLHSTEEKLEQVIHEKEMLETRLKTQESMKDYQIEFQKKEQEETQLRQTLNALQTELDQNTALLKDAQEHLKQARDVITQKGRELHPLHTQIGHLQNEIKNKTQEIADLKERSEQQSEDPKGKGKLDADSVKLTEQLEDLKRQLQQAEKNLAQRQAIQTDFVEIYNITTKDLSAPQVETLRQENRHLNEVLNVEHTTRRQLREEYQKKNNELRKTKRENQGLREQLIASERKNTKFDPDLLALQQRINQKKSQLRTALQELKQAREVIDQRPLQLKAAAGHITTLQKGLKKTSEERDALTQKLAQKQAKIKRLKQEFNQLQAQFNGLKTQLERAQKTKDRLDTLKQQVDQLKSQKITSSRRKDNLSSSQNCSEILRKISITNPRASSALKKSVPTTSNALNTQLPTSSSQPTSQLTSAPITSPLQLIPQNKKTTSSDISENKQTIKGQSPSFARLSNQFSSDSSTGNKVVSGKKEDQVKVNTLAPNSSSSMGVSPTKQSPTLNKLFKGTASSTTPNSAIYNPYNTRSNPTNTLGTRNFKINSKRTVGLKRFSEDN